MKLNFKIITILLLFVASLGYAQETEGDTVADAITKINDKIAKMSKLQINGYVQMQYQKIDSVGAPSFDGGDFVTTDNRFALRRARLKFTYNANPLTKFVIQVDFGATNGASGATGVTMRDAYAAFTEPFLRSFTLTTGMFDRPFGYAISYSSNLRETPERARIFQTLFPNERDLGAKLTFQGKKGTPWEILKAEAGYFTGNGIALENDSKKDFIGHISLSKANNSESLKVAIGSSLYHGGVSNPNNPGKQNITDVDANGNPVVKLVDLGNATARRHYVGYDAQITTINGHWITTLRGEYISGVQPGISGNKSPSAQAFAAAYAATAPDTRTYVRNFQGGYVSLVQSIADSKFSIVGQYDWLDNNTNVAGDQIIKAKGFSKDDLKYETIGLGLIYHYDNNIRFTAYYDIVKSETTTGLGSLYKNDLLDNVLTIRMQYKF